MRGLLGLSVGLIALLQLCNGAEDQQNITQTGKNSRRKCKVACGQHSRCVGPNTCQCDVGYGNENGRCQPVCSKGCSLHSICIAPEKCDCKPNYAWDRKLDICVCKQGYKELNELCQPHCSNGCGAHAHCVAPEKCECLEGYEWDHKSSKCMPKCWPKCGLHSFCHRWNECKCNKFYEPNDIHSLSCSLPLHWWVYLLIGIITVVILCSVAGIIYYFVGRSRNVSYYPNTNFSDTTQIVQ